MVNKIGRYIYKYASGITNRVPLDEGYPFEYTEDFKAFYKTNIPFYNSAITALGGIHIYDCINGTIALFYDRMYVSQDKVNFVDITSKLKYFPGTGDIYDNFPYEYNIRLVGGKIYYYSYSTPNKFYDLVEFDGINETLHENIFNYENEGVIRPTGYGEILYKCVFMDKISKYVLIPMSTKKYSIEIKNIIITNNLTQKGTVINLDEFMENNGFSIISYPRSVYNDILYINGKYILGVAYVRDSTNNSIRYNLLIYTSDGETLNYDIYTSDMVFNTNYKSFNNYYIKSIDANNIILYDSNMSEITFDMPLKNYTYKNYCVANDKLYLSYADDDNKSVLAITKDCIHYENKYFNTNSSYIKQYNGDILIQ